ncbi:hypothetical protein [Hymenobacter psychrophilus]|uniref:hypothetical protein n=1 Tax=Hymenobacter psychrophilus TaxID=651662 RepID=UPI001114F7E8|nr:hypothetical protein [Hymenobacter psychrophilus]
MNKHNFLKLLAASCQLRFEANNCNWSAQKIPSGALPDGIFDEFETNFAATSAAAPEGTRADYKIRAIR